MTALKVLRARSLWARVAPAARFATSLRGAWEDLPESQRQAWQSLGWSEKSWGGKHPAPVTELKTWSELSSAEQAAASHGLGFSQASWDQKLETTGDIVLRDEPNCEPKEPRSDGFMKSILGLARNALPVVRAVASTSPRFKNLGIVADIVSSLDDAAVVTRQGGFIQVANVEDVVYLDDSASMQGLLHLAKSLWHDVATRLQATPTRIVKFGTARHVLMPRVESFSATAVDMGWDASSGATYMWHMIVDDVCSTYAPGPGRLRVFIITDGVDVLSPSPYDGMQGMDAMMRDLQARGFNVEFHIVFVSDSGSQHDALTIHRYRDLALATGGSFLHLDGSEQSVEPFLTAISATSGEHRLQSQMEYERQLNCGQATTFPWYKRLSS